MMREPHAACDDLGSSPNGFDTVIEGLLTSLLIFMPLAFGVVHSWSEEIVIVFCGAVTVCFLLKLVCHRNENIVWSWAYVPLGTFLFIVVLHLIPLPAGLLNLISPNTAAVRTELLNDLPDADRVLRLMPVSLYPNATRHDLRLVLAAAAVFVVVLNVFRQPKRIKRLLMTISLTGGGVVLISLTQNLFGNGKIYWLVPIRNGWAHSGPFVNHSHYGQFVNLSIGAALGLIIVKLCEDFADRSITPAAVLEYFSSPSARILWLLIAVVSLGAASVFISLTRGGMVSMLIASVFTTLLLCRRQPLKGHCWIMIVAALAAFICVLYTGFDAVYERLATLQNLHRYENRSQILKDLLVCYRRFPLLGTGLGTHSVVYPMFDRSTVSGLATHAENEYAQTAEETGAIGLGTLVVFGIIIGLNYIRRIRNNSGSPIHLAVYGLGFGVLAILVHSLGDFGQHLPANAVLTATFCALILVPADENSKPKTKNSKLLMRVIVLIGVAAIWVWAIIGADKARLAESYWKKVLGVEKSFVGKNWQGTNAEFEKLIANAAAALSYQPENVEYRYWFNVYRWRSVSRLSESDAGVAAIPEGSMSVVYDIIEDLHNARTICPTYGAVYCVLGQIEKFILNEAAGAERIRKGFLLAPCDPAACFAAGLLNVEDDLMDSSLEKFRRAIQLDSRYFEAIVDLYVNRISRPDLAITIAANDTSRLSYVAGVLANVEGHEELVNAARAKVVDMLKEKCSQPNTPDWVLASLAAIYERQQHHKEAIECYRRALALNYGQVRWRLELARLLAGIKEMPQAVREARICLRLQPQFKEAEKFITELSVHPAVIGKEIEIP